MDKTKIRPACDKCDATIEVICKKCHKVTTPKMLCKNCFWELGEGLRNLKNENAYLKEKIAPDALRTGLLDKHGNKLYIGDLIAVVTTGNAELHGPYAYYEIVLRGMFPFTNYIRSDYGQILPPGYAGGCLVYKASETKMMLYGHEVHCEDVEKIDQLPPVKQRPKIEAV